MKRTFKRFYKMTEMSPDFAVNGVGVREPMGAGIINRPGGTGDSLLMFFYNEVQVNIANEIMTVPADSMVYWEKCGHYYGNTDISWMHSWVHFDGPEAMKIMRRSGMRPFQIITPPIDLVEKLLLEIDHEMSRISPDQIIVRNQFEIFIRKIIRAGASETFQIPERMLEIRRYIEDNYRKRLALEKLARKFALSRPHLSAEFKRWFGLAPGEYQIEQRLREAEMLLMDNNLQITDVAERVGWDDVCHFSKIFKKHRGKTPSTMRNKAI
jgi:AraC-like DNA-binding protein